MKIGNTFLLFFLPLSFIALTFLIYTSDFSIQSFFATCPPHSLSDGSVARTSFEKPDLSILIGVFTVADSYVRRQLIRQVYWQQSGDYSNVEVDIRFVICNLTTEEQKVLVALEIMRHDDIIILDCVENVEKGKTHTYFSSVPKMSANHPYDYVMKCDDDTYIRLGNLVDSLMNKPREDVYYGLAVPCEIEEDDPDFKNRTFMSGMGYLLSWDLVEWISTTEELRNHTEGAEDINLAMWLNFANKGRNRYNNRPKMYDYKGGFLNLCFHHDFIPDTIAIHRLKENLEWARTLKYFNVTEGLKPSKFYHIP
ncbi:hypothetical protein LUZ60_008049 [Juncus effusus]|nr:hypothetical protein LUZ60_008049 [Juncus effusus]